VANMRINRQNNSAVLHGSTARLVSLMAGAAVVLLLVLSMGITKAGAVDAPNPDLYPPCTSAACQPDVVTPDGQPPKGGETVHLVFHGFEPGSTVTVTFYVDTNADTVLEEVTLTGVADEFGDVEFDWNIPAGVAGDVVYEVAGIDEETGEVRHESGSLYVEAENLTPDTSVPDNGPLPYTGSNSTNMVRIGLVLIVAGGISVVAVRRRNAHADA
jgi:LPXTG-motif cell wall-anchored protein